MAGLSVGSAVTTLTRTLWSLLYHSLGLPPILTGSLLFYCAIEYMDVVVNSLVGMLITNKICRFFCKLWPVNLIGMVLLCLGGIFSIDLTRAMLCRSSLFLVYIRKELCLCIKRYLLESQQYGKEYHFSKSMPKIKSALGSLSHMTKV